MGSIAKTRKINASFRNLLWQNRGLMGEAAEQGEDGGIEGDFGDVLGAVLAGLESALAQGAPEELALLVAHDQVIESAGRLKQVAGSV